MMEDQVTSETREGAKMYSGPLLCKPCGGGCVLHLPD